MNPLVSIIVPVYNIKKYITLCIESIINQTYTNLEIILVDDGSTDGSYNICEEFRDKDKRICLYCKENGGLSSARNFGIEHAKGDYLFFVDGDDYIHGQCIENSIKMVKEENCDIAIVNSINVKEDSNIMFESKKAKKIYSYTATEAIEESLYQKKFNCSSCGKLFCRDVFNGVSFPEGKTSEDLAICHLLFDQTNKICFFNGIGYYYRQRNNSIMHMFSENRMDALCFAKQIILYCEENHPSIVPAAKCRLFNISIHLLLELPNEKIWDKYRTTLNEDIKSTRRFVLQSSKSRIREKCAVIVSLFGEDTLKKVWKSRFAIKKKIY